MTGNGGTAWKAYRSEGLKRAARLGNRGSLRFDEDGRLTQDILDAYRRTGFYVFTGVLSPEECRELETEFDRVLDNAPLVNDGEVDRHGRPSRFSKHYSVEPPWSSNEGEEEDSEAEGAPGIVRMLSHPLMIMDSALRAYGHPDILKMIASVNGPDFVPFSESVFHKAAYQGFPTRWHQDGRTHWAEDGASLERPDGLGKTHGVNLSVSWSHCTPENGLWVIPGSHRRWRLADGGEFPPITEWLPDAVPMTLAPGDCGLVNRSSMHGSYPNRSAVRRVNMIMGFHNRASAIGAETTNVHAFARMGDKRKTVKYTKECVLRRARMIPLAIDARRQRYPDEVPYEYLGSYIGGGEWNAEARAEICREGDEYWQRNMTL